MLIYSQLVNKLINSLRCPHSWTAGFPFSVTVWESCFFLTQISNGVLGALLRAQLFGRLAKNSPPDCFCPATQCRSLLRRGGRALERRNNQLFRAVFWMSLKIAVQIFLTALRYGQGRLPPLLSPNHYLPHLIMHCAL